MEKEYKGLKENLERFKNDFSDEKTRLLFSIGYKQGYDQALTLTDVGNCATYSATNKLRYKAHEIDLGNGTAKVEYRLQQMWQGSDGSQNWQWIEYVD